jgi:hypothetical protein
MMKKKEKRKALAQQLTNSNLETCMKKIAFFSSFPAPPFSMVCYLLPYSSLVHATAIIRGL